MPEAEYYIMDHSKAWKSFPDKLVSNSYLELMEMISIFGLYAVI